MTGGIWSTPTVVDVVAGAAGLVGGALVGEALATSLCLEQAPAPKTAITATTASARRPAITPPSSPPSVASPPERTREASKRTPLTIPPVIRRPGGSEAPGVQPQVN